MRSSNSACMNTFDFTTEIIGSVQMTVFEIVAPHNVDNWIQCYMTYVVDQSKQCAQRYLRICVSKIPFRGGGFKMFL